MKTRYDHAYVLNVLSDDHPGIIAAVSGAIVRLNGNIDACSQTVLGGFFTQILVVSLPEPIEPAKLEEMVRSSGDNGLQVVARRHSATDSRRHSATERFVITAFGPDRPGIIHRFSQYLAGKDINITDLYWDCTGDDFILVTQVEIPAHWELSLLQADIEALGGELGLTVRLQHENVFVATNQLRPPR